MQVGRRTRDRGQTASATAKEHRPRKVRFILETGRTALRMGLALRFFLQREQIANIEAFINMAKGRAKDSTSGRTAQLMRVIGGTT